MQKNFIAFSVFVGLFSSGLSLAGSTSWQKELSASSAGQFKAKKKCQLNYTLSWNGTINSGYINVLFDRNKGSKRNVKVHATGGTNGLVKSLFPYNFKSTSIYRGNTLRPVSYDLWEKTKDETKSIKAHFSGKKVSSKVTTIPFDTNKPLYSSHSFQHNHLFDLFSSALYIGSQALENGDRLNMIVYPFDRPYYAKVKVLGREQHQGHPCIKLDLKLSKINDDLSLKNYKKMKNATMWITDNADRVMVEMRSEIFIGDVRATLKSSKWN